MESIEASVLPVIHAVAAIAGILTPGLFFRSVIVKKQLSVGASIGMCGVIFLSGVFISMIFLNITSWLGPIVVVSFLIFRSKGESEVFKKRLWGAVATFLIMTIIYQVTRYAVLYGTEQAKTIITAPVITELSSKLIEN